MDYVTPELHRFDRFLACSTSWIIFVLSILFSDLQGDQSGLFCVRLSGTRSEASLVERYSTLISEGLKGTSYIDNAVQSAGSKI